jgi:UDP-N-acetylmuramoyl-L-alanine---L-glutamate ligase
MIFDLSQFDDKDVVFVGIGKGRSMSGFEAFLHAHGHPRSFTGVHRDREANEEWGYLRDYNPETTVFVKNESVPPSTVPVPYTTTLELFFTLARANNLLTVGITGTKGKSTTTALTASIVEHAGKPVVLAGNIGISPFDALSTATPDTIFVLELSSYMLADLDVSPHISVCLNLYNDHTDWHGSLEEYWEAKHNIMRTSGPDDVFIYNPDFPAMQEWAAEAGCKTIAINPSERINLDGAQLYGRHNELNALVAREIARQFGIDDDTIMEAIRAFAPLRHRMQTVATKHGITYVDDAIGMTPESTMASLRAVTESIGTVGCLLLGGQDRNYDFSELMQVVASYNIPHLVLFPETEAKMEAALPSSYTPQLHHISSMADAVMYASQHAPAGSVVLLSTAAPSYLLWRDFEEKGDQFQDAVNALTD